MTRIAPDPLDLVGIDEETLRTDLAVELHKVESVLRSADGVGPGSSMNEVASAVAHLELLESILEQIDHLVGGLRHFGKDLSRDGHRTLGSMDLLLVMLRAAQAEMTARIDAATS